MAVLLWQLFEYYYYYYHRGHGCSEVHVLLHSTWLSRIYMLQEQKLIRVFLEHVPCVCIHVFSPHFPPPCNVCEVEPGIEAVFMLKSMNPY